MAPEQATGDPHVDRRADVFSAGIVLWEVLAARRLFKAENEAATLSRVISEPVPDIREVNPKIDPDVAAIVMTALERDRDSRYPTCQDFADDLEAAAQAAGILATTREVATYVTSVIGQEIAQQREAVRGWLARSEPSQARPDAIEAQLAAVPASQSSAPMLGVSGERSGMVPTGQAPFDPGPYGNRRRSKAPIVIAAAAIVGFAVVGLLALAFRSEPPPAAAHPPPAQPAAPLAVPAATAVPPPQQPATAESAVAISKLPVAPPAGGPRTFARGGRHAAAASSATAPAASAPAAPPKPAAPADDVDLTSPYR